MTFAKSLSAVSKRLTLPIPISSAPSVDHQNRGPTHLRVLYNPLDQHAPHNRLWSAFEVLCFIEHVAGSGSTFDYKAPQLTSNSFSS